MSLSVASSFLVLSIYFFVFIALYVDNVSKRVEITTEDVVWVIQQAGILGILTALAGIWYQRHKDRMSEIDRVRRTCYTILEEINDTDKSLNSGKRQQTKRERRNYVIKYTHSFLNESAFDSLIHSGLFDSKTQINLSDLYLAIKFHNRMLHYKREFQDLSVLSTSSAGINSNCTDRIEYLERYLTQLENVTNELLPMIALQLLEELRKLSEYPDRRIKPIGLHDGFVRKTMHRNFA